mmetsp:Transcript_9542/g.25921  ORF Transcript_9542/g.25921 Transcript_9542/m.25921 type:complete len:211 (-) Transcript_9542:79-711(-)
MPCEGRREGGSRRLCAQGLRHPLRPAAAHLPPRSADPGHEPQAHRGQRLDHIRVCGCLDGHDGGAALQPRRHEVLPRELRPPRGTDRLPGGQRRLRERGLHVAERGACRGRGGGRLPGYDGLRLRDRRRLHRCGALPLRGTALPLRLRHGPRPLAALRRAGKLARHRLGHLRGPALHLLHRARHAADPWRQPRGAVRRRRLLLRLPEPVP